MPSKLIIRLFIPLLAVGFILLLFWLGLHRDPRALSAVNIGQQLPSFHLPKLGAQEKISSQTLKGEPYILHVWASWCMTCRSEHPFWVDVAHQKTIKVVGFVYEDSDQEAIAWLKTHGNPFAVSLADHRGRVAIDLGVYGTPETFLIDKHNRIRFKQVGAMTNTVWKNKLLPLIQKINQES